MRRTPNVERVLRSLLEAGDAYGLDIAQQTNMKWQTVYRVLARMRDEEWVTEELETDETGQRRRYRLTDFGREVAVAWLEPSGEHVGRYRRRGDYVRAIRWTGANYDKVQRFVGPSVRRSNDLLWLTTVDGNEESCRIGWWIIEGVENCYPIPPNVFLATYEVP